MIGERVCVCVVDTAKYTRREEEADNTYPPALMQVVTAAGAVLCD